MTPGDRLISRYLRGDEARKEELYRKVVERLDVSYGADTVLGSLALGFVTGLAVAVLLVWL